MPDGPQRINLDPQAVELPPSPYRSHQEHLPQKIITGGLRDIVVYNVRTNYKSLDKAHKASFIPRADPEPEPGYKGLVPDISGLPEPTEPVLSQQEREQIISTGTGPEVRPFMARLRIAASETRAKRQHRRAQSALRNAYVAHHVATNVIKDGDYLAPEDNFRPRTLRERTAAKRMSRLLKRANHQNAYANIVEEMNTYTTDPSGNEQTVHTVDFDRNKKNLSIFERAWQRSAGKLYERRKERADRLMLGRRVPFIGKKFDKRIGLLSFSGLADGGFGKPVDKDRVKEILKKRDDAVLKAEALRRARS